ncbi:uncharacterized protein LOC123526980 [Mercenaria mercenaria]|uniref:uncharacterized protein LOC123526980 n=1 Tax=Mercenaria mercenaria TaxID=6596 RepID=UPI00234F1D4C|nr:uncharacterized protein LOC123526980 [Mercenaria mercenaria]
MITIKRDQSSLTFSRSFKIISGIKMVDTKCTYFIPFVSSLITLVLVGAADIPYNVQINFTDLEIYIEKLVDDQVEKRLASQEFVRRDDVDALIATKLATREFVLREEMEATIAKKLKVQELVLLEKLKAEFVEEFAPIDLYQNIENETGTENDLNSKFIRRKETKSEFAVRDSGRKDLMQEQIEKELTIRKTKQRIKVETKRRNKRDPSVENEYSKELFTDETIEKQEGRQNFAENKIMENSNRDTITREIRSTVYNNDRNFKRLSLNVGHQVGFTACVSSDVVTLGDKHTIIFDKVISNIGGAYHYHIGILIAPVKGMYVLHLSATSSPNRAQQLAFIKDGVEIGTVFPNAVGTNTYQTAGCHWVIELEQGSEVWIQTKGAGQMFGQCFTVFSGFLLNEMD